MPNPAPGLMPITPQKLWQYADPNSDPDPSLKAWHETLTSLLDCELAFDVMLTVRMYRIIIPNAHTHRYEQTHRHEHTHQYGHTTVMSTPIVKTSPTSTSTPILKNRHRYEHTYLHEYTRFVSKR